MVSGLVVQSPDPVNLRPSGHCNETQHLNWLLIMQLARDSYARHRDKLNLILLDSLLHNLAYSVLHAE